MKKSPLIALAALALSAAAIAKLPPPSDEAKAKAAEAAAKTAHTGKVEAYLLCKAQDKVAARTNKTVTKPVKGAAAPASSCVDPGAFVYVPAVAGAAPAAAVPLAAASAAKK